MIRITTKRTIITITCILFLILFIVSLVFAATMNYKMRDGINWAYYSFSILMVVMSTVYVCLITHSFSYSDTDFCSVLCYLMLILYCASDVGVRNLFPLFTQVDMLNIFIHIRDYLTFLVMTFMLFDQYSSIFHSKNGYKTSILVALFFDLGLVLIMPSANELNIHYFFIILLLLLASVFHTIAYNMTASNLKFKLRFWNTICAILSEIGIFMFVISLNTIVSVFGSLLVFLSFIVFCLDTLKRVQD